MKCYACLSIYSHNPVQFEPQYISATWRTYNTQTIFLLGSTIHFNGHQPIPHFHLNDSTTNKSATITLSQPFHWRGSTTKPRQLSEDHISPRHPTMGQSRLIPICLHLSRLLQFVTPVSPLPSRPVTSRHRPSRTHTYLRGSVRNNQNESPIMHIASRRSTLSSAEKKPYVEF